MLLFIALIILIDTPDTKIYFTANGTKPLPFQRKIGGNEVTHRYTAPFTLKEGKRTIKAVAVTRLFSVVFT
jgi:annexin A6